MIQRIQTVFLFLAIVCMGLYLYMPLITVENGTFTDSVQGYDITYTMPFMDVPYRYMFTLIFAGIAAGFSLIAIFLYKKRSVQMLLCWFAIVFIVAAQAFVFYKYQTKVFIGDVILRKWNLFSLLAIVFEILAFAYIRKDEETIRSMDRLR